MRLSDAFAPVYARVGWRPVSGSIKPVHLANGLFRSLLGERRDVTDAVSLLVPWRRKSAGEPDPDRTHASLTGRDPRYATYAGEGGRAAFESLREHLRGLLAADGAVFPSAEHSSLTLTCGQMVSGDANDRNVGRFMAGILMGEDGKGRLAELLARTVCSERMPEDPISRAAWPLLAEGGHPAPACAPDLTVLSMPETRGFATRMAQASECLAGHEEAHGNRLASMRRGVSFCCLGLVAHAQWLPCHGNPELRMPLFAEVGAPRRSRLAAASSASLDAFHFAFEGWIVDALANVLTEGAAPIALPPPERMEEFFTSLATDKGEAPGRQLVEERMARLEQAAAGKGTWARTVARALFLCHQSEAASGGPRQFVDGIARRCGLVYPHFQGGDGDRRVRLSPQVLDTLVRSCVPVGTMSSLADFLGVLWDRFGIIIGGRGVADTGPLRRAGAEVGPADLETNARTFVATLEELGLARRRPDGIAHVGTWDG